MPPALVKALSRATISTPTPVQEAVIPDALEGRDVLGRAATGSGKTLAFGLPIVVRMAASRSQPKAPRALIVVPTRELAGQVRTALEPMADAMGVRIATVYGGTPYDRQIKRLRAGVDIVVATPGRLKDLINRGACRLDRVQITVLDEADHLCDLGFFPDVSELVAMTPSGGQRMLLSATLDGDVDKLVQLHLSAPVTHDCEPDEDKPDMQHHVLVTGFQDKLETVAALLRANPRSIVFTRTRHGATTLASDLAELGVRTVDLHGALSQNARERNLRKFRTGQADVVVATDVAARGIHVDNVALVVHYDAPTEPKAYLHRSGRTARAGSSGTVVTLTTSRQAAAVTALQRRVGVTALHHDARTSPRPLTVASLAEHGREPVSTTAAPRAAERPKRRPQRTSAGRSSRSGSYAARRTTPAAPTTRPSVAPTTRPSGARSYAARLATPKAPASSSSDGSSPSRAAQESRHEQSRHLEGGSPQRRTSHSKKARWTTAQRRAVGKPPRKRGGTPRSASRASVGR